jgi:complement component 1 Q subcomponent-binding protein, mitochondrial
MSRSVSRVFNGLLAARRACADLSGSALQGCSRVLANSAVASETSTSAISIARTIWSSAPSCSSSLVNILKDELKHETQSYAKPDVIASGPPAPFTLSEAPGDTMLTLTRTYQGETISVDLHVNSQPAPELESDAEEETL